MGLDNENNNNNILEIRNLSVDYKTKDGYFKGVRNLNLDLAKNQSIGIIGESGSGKTSLGKAILNLIDRPHKVMGQVNYKGNNILELKDSKLRDLRWKEIALVFQNSLDVLNPLLTIGEQIAEVLKRHLKLDKIQIREKLIDLMYQVDLEIDVIDKYPHELSGGMRQKALIAMAISCDPKILIVDEPTSALDILSKDSILKLLKKIKNERDISLIVISHELDTILRLTEEVNVMYFGSIVERGPSSEVLKEPRHVYTRGLIKSSPSIDPFGDMWGIPGELNYDYKEGCPFRNRCIQSSEICSLKLPKLEYIGEARHIACNNAGIIRLLRAEGLEKSYNDLKACKDCSLEIKTGEIVSLIGESGSGKTSLASMISGILEMDAGSVEFLGESLRANNFSSKKQGIQMVFQDPYTSINENLKVGQVIGEPLLILGEKNIDEKVKNVVTELGFSNLDILDRKCKTLSGGQRQRVALARSLIMEPRLLVADEISSMLDISTEANTLRLLKKLQNQRGFSILYITHDLAIARKISDRVYVMKDGSIVEEGNVKDIFTEPKTEYMKELISAYEL